jgi:hypothetical protein
MRVRRSLPASSDSRLSGRLKARARGSSLRTSEESQAPGERSGAISRPPSFAGTGRNSRHLRQQTPSRDRPCCAGLAARSEGGAGPSGRSRFAAASAMGHLPHVLRDLAPESAGIWREGQRARGLLTTGTIRERGRVGARWRLECDSRGGAGTRAASRSLAAWSMRRCRSTADFPERTPCRVDETPWVAGHVEEMPGSNVFQQVWIAAQRADCVATSANHDSMRPAGRSSLVGTP